MRRKLTLQEIQLQELNILQRTAEWMEANGIAYSLIDGTLLGAVRHDGFIPWDDDVDICVPRADYQRMLALLRKGEDCAPSGLEVWIPGQKGVYFPFVKFLAPNTISSGSAGKGIETPLNIDVFPFDYLPTDDRKYAAYVRTAKRLRNLMWLGNKPRQEIPGLGGKSLRRKLKWRAFQVLYFLAGGYRNLSRLIDLHSRWINWRWRGSERMGNITWLTYERHYFHSRDGFCTQSHAFEGDGMRILCEYDEYLRNAYGDYMTPPPPEERAGQHYLYAFVLEQ